MKLDVPDLMHLRYAPHGTDRRTGVDCLWIVRQVAERVFPDLDPREIPLSEDEAQAAVRGFDSGEGRWYLAGRKWFEAGRLGEILVGSKGGHPWCAITVNVPGRLAVSANAERGVFTAPIRALEGLEAIYRRRA